MDIELRKFDMNKDLRAVFDMMNSDDQYMFSTKMQFNTLQSFEVWFMDRINTNFRDFFLIELNSRVIGFVHNYDLSLVNGHCKIAVYVIKKYRAIGVAGYAYINYLHSLFNKYPLRKIYLTIYDYNSQSILTNEKTGAKKVGVLREYRYYDGKYYDLEYYELSRELFYDGIGKIVEGK